jgi:hypothetical protein
MADRFIDKAVEKGEFKAKLEGIARDVECVIKACDDSRFFPSSGHISEMMKRYRAVEFKENKFNFANSYGAALDAMSGGGIPGVDREDLKRFERELEMYGVGNI